MQRALAAHDAAAALRAYREATSLMRGSEVLDAAQIHTLGARAQRLAGDNPAATDAEHAATVALASFRAKLPADLRSAAGTSVLRTGMDKTTP